MNKQKGRRFYLNSDECTFAKRAVTINPGYTALVGCNGIGKTTLLKLLQSKLERSGTVCVVHPWTDDFNNVLLNVLAYGDAETLENLEALSSGMLVARNIRSLACKAIFMMQQLKKQGKKELWILADTFDSGLSIDAIKDIRTELLEPLWKAAEEYGIIIHLVAAVNTYEATVGAQCFDVAQCKYISIRSYDKFQRVIMASREFKEQRERTEAKC